MGLICLGENTPNRTPKYALKFIYAYAYMQQKMQFFQNQERRRTLGSEWPPLLSPSTPLFSPSSIPAPRTLLLWDPAARRLGHGPARGGAGLLLLQDGLQGRQAGLLVLPQDFLQWRAEGRRWVCHAPGKGSGQKGCRGGQQCNSSQMANWGVEDAGRNKALVLMGAEAILRPMGHTQNQEPITNPLF